MRTKTLPLGVIRKVPLPVAEPVPVTDRGTQKTILTDTQAATPRALARQPRRRRNTQPIAMVYVEGCTYEDGRAVSGLWEALSVRLVDGEQFLALTNGPERIEVPQRCCRGVMVHS
jgi:hypothetical protein